MMNNLEININSLCCKILINLAYLFLGTLITISIVGIIYYLHLFDFFTIYTILIAIPIVILIEIYRQNTSFNSFIINNIYKFLYNLNKEPFRITKFIDKILDIGIAVLFVYYIYAHWNIPTTLNDNKHPVFEAIGIVITV